MTKEEAKSCIGTIEMLQRLAYNIHGVMDVIDADNCKKIIKALEQEPVLDKIRSEIDNALSDGMIHKKTVLGIIDKYKVESEEGMSLSQNIIEHARRIYPKAASHVGRLTDKQFYEIEKQCDIDFYKLVDQDIIYTIRYKGESEVKVQ